MLGNACANVAQSHLSPVESGGVDLVQLATLSEAASTAASSTAYAVDTGVKEAMLWVSLQPRSTMHADRVNTIKVLGQQVAADAMAAAEACALTYEIVSDISDSILSDKSQAAATTLAASDVSNHVTCTTAAAREIAQLCMDILEEAVDVRGSPLAHSTACRCAEKALNSIEVASAAEQHKQNLDNALAQAMSNAVNHPPTSTFSQVRHISSWKETQEEQWQQQQQQKQQSTEDNIQAWAAPAEILALRNGGPMNQDESLVQGSVGKMAASCPPLVRKCKGGASTLHSIAQVAHELEVYLMMRAAHIFGERCAPFGACGNAEQCPADFKDVKPCAAACWRYGRALAVGLVREEEILSDADLASFVCHYDCTDTVMQGGCLERLLQERHLSSLVAALKVLDVQGSEQKKDCTALVEVQDEQRPLNGCGSAHDWDACFRCLGYSGPCNPVRSTATPWKQWLQQQQQQQHGKWGHVGRGHSLSNLHSCNVQEALDGGIAEHLTGLVDDTWSVDSVTLSSLHLMSLQSRSRQKRGVAVKQSSPAEMDAPSARKAFAALNNSGPYNRQTRPDARQEDREIREFLHLVFGSRLDCSGSQNTPANVASRVQKLKEMSPPAIWTVKTGVRQNPDITNTRPRPLFGSTNIVQGNPLWEQDAAVAAFSACPRPEVFS